MNAQSRKIISFGAIVILLLVAAVAINGCKKSEPQTTTGHEGHDHATMTAEPAEMVEAAKAVVADSNRAEDLPDNGGQPYQ